MAISTIGAIGLGAAGLGSFLGGNASAKGAKQAAQAQAQASAESNALTRDIYNQNKTILTPNINRGEVAANYLNAFLGLPTQAVTTQPTTGPAPSVAGTPPVNSGLAGLFPAAFAQQILNGQYGDGTVVGPNGKTPGVTTPGQVIAPAVTQADAQNAFGSYIKNSDYGFQFATGSNALNSGYAGNGALQSGAAMKALEGYRQNLQSGYRNEYLGQLGNQQGIGLSAGSALAGVGQNYAGMVSANNNNAAAANANAALIKGQNNPFANALSTLGGGLLGIGRQYGRD